MTDTDTDTLILPSPPTLVTTLVIEDLPLYLPEQVTGPIDIVSVLPDELHRMVAVKMPTRTGPLGPRRSGPPVSAYLHVANTDAPQFPALGHVKMSARDRLLALAASVAGVLAAAAAGVALVMGVI